MNIKNFIKQEAVLTIVKKDNILSVECAEDLSVLKNHSNESCPLNTEMSDPVANPVRAWQLHEDYANAILKYRDQIQKVDAWHKRIEKKKNIKKRRVDRAIDIFFKKITLFFIYVIDTYLLSHSTSSVPQLPTCQCTIVSLTEICKEEVVDGKLKKTRLVRSIELGSTMVTFHVYPDFFSGGAYIEALEIIALSLYSTKEVVIELIGNDKKIKRIPLSFLLLSVGSPSMRL
ncbi:MAG: hypothetical protein Q8P11_01185 [bacterium]|nr:hypothetical protein [bacterium]